MNVEYCYYKKGLAAMFVNLWQILWFGYWKGCKLLIDFTAASVDLMPGQHEATMKMMWTDAPTDQICRMKYKTAKGFNDNILFLFISQYARLHNFRCFDVQQKDSNGIPIYCLDTASTLNDAMVSESDKAFLKGMSRVALQSMDLQTIIMIVIVGVGAIFGMHMLGIF